MYLGWISTLVLEELGYVECYVGILGRLVCSCYLCCGIALGVKQCVYFVNSELKCVIWWSYVCLFGLEFE